MRLGALSAIVVAGCRIGFEPVRPPDARTQDAAGVDAAGPGDAASGAHLVQVVEPPYVDGASLVEPISVTAGDALIVATYWNDASKVVTVTDAAGVLTWTGLGAMEVATGCGPPSGGSAGELWYAPITVSGTLDVTISQGSGTSPLGARLLEYAGTGAFGGGMGTLPQGPSNTMTEGTYMPSGPLLVIAMFSDTNGTGMMSPGPGWTLRTAEDGFYALVEDNAPGAAGTIMPTATLPVGVSDACWVTESVAFQTP